MPTDEWFDRQLLEGEDDEEARRCWRWLFDKREAHYGGDKVAPLARPLGPDRARKVVVASLDATAGPEAAPGEPAALRMYDGNATATIRLAGELGAPAHLARGLFKARWRSALIVFPGGGRSALHLLLRWHAAGLTALGYTLLPVVSGSTIKAIEVRKGRNVWWLCDYGSVAGVEADQHQPGPESLSLRAGGSPDGLALARASLVRQQEWLRSALATGLRPTVGGAAIAALRRTLDADFAKFRPPALLAAMLRDGRGYRGGFIHATPYRGELWQVDINRAYAWAMGEALPKRVALARHRDAAGDEGTWLCRVDGPGRFPVYLAPWDDKEARFSTPRAWHGLSCLAVLCGAEMAGIRALGYRVAPGWGYANIATWRASRFVTAVCSELAAGRRGSEADRFAKALAVSAYGRMAMGVERQSVIYSADEPRGGWYPFVDVHGEVLEGLWARPEKVYTSGQQLDVAATITARVRGAVYCGVAALAGAGVTTVYCDTDSLMCGGDPAAVLGNDSERPGSWRLVARDACATVAGKRLAQLGGRTIAAGLPGAGAEVVEAAFAGRNVEVAGHLLNLPWLAAQPWTERVWDVKRKAGAP